MRLYPGCKDCEFWTLVRHLRDSSLQPGSLKLYVFFVNNPPARKTTPSKM